MRQLIAARSWLTVFQLPVYAPELNPVDPPEGELDDHLGYARHDPESRDAAIPATGTAAKTVLTEARPRRFRCYETGIPERT